MRHENKPVTKSQVNGMLRFVEQQLAWVKDRQYYLRHSPNTRSKEIARLRKIYHEVPKAIEKVNANRKFADSEGLARLDGRVVSALKNHGLVEYVGAVKLATGYQLGYLSGERIYDLRLFEVWYCKAWFADFLKQVTGEKRKVFYQRIKEIQSTNDKDALDAELGLMVLHSME